MYNTNNILNKKEPEKIDRNYILKRVSEQDIFTKYVGDFKLGSIYNSPLRKDKNPSFGIFVSNKTGNLLYKDLAADECGDVFKFVKKLKGLSTYEETIKEIISDLNILNMEAQKLSSNRRLVQTESKISITRKPFTKIELEYWQRFAVTKSILDLFKVNSISKFFVNGLLKDTSTTERPMFAYKVFNKFKIYKPLDPKTTKWRGNLSYLDIQGFEQLPETGDLLVITKSLKDVMTLYSMGYTAVAPSSEGIMIPQVVINNLKSRFKRILIFYDRDKTGMTFARKLSKTYSLNGFFINKKHKTKDISDFTAKYGINKSIELMKELLQ